MKTIQLYALGILVCLFAFAGCQKEVPAPQIINNCDTVYVRDTVYIHDTVTLAGPSRLEILTLKEWQVDEVVRNMNGVNTHYIRGGVNTTGTNYQNLKIKFNTNGTGSYTDDTGATFPMTWNFTAADQRNVHIDVSGYVTYDWDMVELKDNYLHSTTRGNTSYMNTARYIQVP
jgi:hypothetical protein